MDRGALPSEHFAQLMSMFDALCDLPAAEQADRLRSLPTPGMRTALAQMLAADARSLALLSGRAVSAPRPPRVLDAPVSVGPFVVDTPLGVGGMGEVWHGRAPDDDLAVAVKLIRADHRAPDALAAAFNHEVRAVARLHHPHVVTVFDYGQLDAAAAETLGMPPGSPWLAMALADGGSLAAAVRQPPPWETLGRLLVELLGALAHAHARGVLHLDLKPQNVLLHSGPDGASVRLADFGLAHLARGQAPGTLAGTLPFMAPEQLAGSWRDYGPSTDLFALGVMGWLLLHGDLPDATPTWAPRIAVPTGLRAWLERLMAPAPRDRFACAADAARALTDAGVPARPVAAPAPPGALLRNAGMGLHGLRALPLVGREAERRALWAALERVERTGAPAACVVRGVAGIGKSRLARWLCEHADETGAARAFAAVIDLEGLANVRALVRHALRCQGLEGDAFRRRASQLGVDPDLAAAALLPNPDRPSPPTVLWQLVRSRVGAGVPIVVWLDDVHASAAAVAAVADGLTADAGPVLFVLTVQEEALAERPGVDAAVRALPADVVEVRAATGPDHEAVIGATLQLAPPLASRVARHTDGSPLFAVQLIGDWIGQGLLRPTPDGFALRDGVEVTIPDGLADVWRRRVHDLGAGPPDALELAAVLGLQVEPELWRAVCAEAGVVPDGRLLERLSRRRLARPTAQGGWQFVHTLLREAICRQARDEGRWARHNRACAAALGPRAAAEGDGDIYERLAAHHEAAGARSDALRCIAVAVGRHEVLGRTPRALALLDAWRGEAERLGVPPHDPAWGEFHAAAGTAAQNTSRFADAEVHFRAALDGAEAHGWPIRGEAIHGLGVAAEIRSDLAEAGAFYARAAALTADPVRSAGMTCDHARTLVFSDAARTEAVVREVLVRPLPDTRRGNDARARAWDLVQLACYFDGRVDDAWAAMEQAHALYAAGGNHGGLFSCALARARLCGVREDLPQLAEAVAALEAYAAGMGGEAKRVPAFFGHWLAVLRGDPADHHAGAVRMLEEVEEAGAAWIVGDWHRAVVVTAAAAGDWAQCRASLEAVRGRPVTPEAAQCFRMALASAVDAGEVAVAAALRGVLDGAYSPGHGPPH